MIKLKNEDADLEKELFIDNTFKNQYEVPTIIKNEFESHSDDIEKGHFHFDSNLHAENDKNKQQDNILYSEKIRCKRILIEFSLIILLISIICLFGYFFIIQRNYTEIHTILQTKTQHFHCNLYFMYSIWFIITASIIISIIRFIFINDERKSTLLKNLNKSEEEKISFLENKLQEKAFSEINSQYSKNLTTLTKRENCAVSEIPKIVNYYPNSKIEILDLIYSKINIWYYLGNFFFSITTFSIIVHKHFDFEGDIFPTIIGLISLTCYIPSYLKIKSKIMRETLNKYTINSKISFLLGLNSVIMIIFLVKYLETQDVLMLNMNIENVSIYIYFFIFCFEVLFMVYLSDTYIVFILIIFKLGVVIENFKYYNKNNKFTFVFFVISIFFFISFLIIKTLKEKEDKEEKELKFFEKNYKDKLFIGRDSI